MKALTDDQRKALLARIGELSRNVEALEAVKRAKLLLWKLDILTETEEYDRAVKTGRGVQFEYPSNLKFLKG